MSVTPTELPENIDETYPDNPSDPSVQAHQEHHDTIHTAVNEMSQQWADLEAAVGGPQLVMTVTDDGTGFFDLDVSNLWGDGGRVYVSAPPNPPELWEWQPNTEILPGTWIQDGEDIYLARPWGFTLGQTEPDWDAADDWGVMYVDGIPWQDWDDGTIGDVTMGIPWEPESFMPEGWYYHLGHLWARWNYGGDPPLTGETEPDWQQSIDEGHNWTSDGDGEWYRIWEPVVIWSPGAQVIGQSWILGGERLWRTTAGGYAPLVTGDNQPEWDGDDAYDNNIRWDPDESWLYHNAHEYNRGIARVRLGILPPGSFKGGIEVHYNGAIMFFGVNEWGTSLGTSDSESYWWFQWEPDDPYWYDD